MSKRKITGDVFVDSCFVLDSPPVPDDRIGSRMEGLKDVSGLVKQGRLEDAWKILDAHHMALKDLDFIYAFKAIILQKNGQTDAAKKTLLVGLKFGRGKFLLYERLGFLSFETGRLDEAIQWWIKSIVAMKMLGKWAMWEPFLYLSGVAEALSNETHSRVLTAWVREISPHGELRLDDRTMKTINEAVALLPTGSVLKAMDILCLHYIPRQETEPCRAIPGIHLPGHPNVPADRDHLSAFKTLFGENKRNAWVIRFAATVLALALILLFLQFLKTPRDRSETIDSRPPAETEQPPAPVERAPYPLPDAPAIQKKTAAVEMEQKKEAPGVELSEDPTPRKEKYPFLKSKAKAAGSDIKKKE